MILCDLPEILNRMHIVAKTPLDEMLDMFNNVMKYVERRRGPSHPGANAVFHYPEMFLKFRDEYTESMIRKIVEENA